MALGTWIVRGFGTAIMHGGATAIFAIVSHTLMGQHPTHGWLAKLPGFLVAVVAHSVYNHFFLMPIVNTLIVFASLPILFTIVFQQSERAITHWLDIGFDADAEIIELINSGDFTSSRIGTYLHTLTEKFEGPVVVDMLCYLRLHKELAMRAKGLLMMREQGFDDKPGEMTRAKLEELKFLVGQHRPDRPARNEAVPAHEPPGSVADLHAVELGISGSVDLLQDSNRGLQRVQKGLKLAQLTAAQAKGLGLVMPDHRIGRFVVVIEHVGQCCLLSFVPVRGGAVNVAQRWRPEGTNEISARARKLELGTRRGRIVTEAPLAVERVGEHLANAGRHAPCREPRPEINQPGVVKLVVGQ